MLKKEVADKIKGFGFDVDKLIAAIKDDAEVDYEVPAIEVFTADQLVTRDANTKVEAKREGVAEGKAAGLEIAGKAIAKKFNLPATVNTKDLDKVVEAVNTTVATGDEGLRQQVSLLQQDKDTLLREKETLAQQTKALGLDKNLISFFPANRDQSILNDDERLMIVKNSLQFEEVDGKTVVKKNGEVLRHPKTQDPLAPKDAIETLFTERKWISESAGGGRGGGNASAAASGGGTGGVRTFKAAQDKWLSENPNGNVISPECTAYVGAIAKEVGNDFQWHTTD